MSEILCQKTMPWGNILLGKSKYYIHAYGCFITVIAEILGLTPDAVNAKLNAVDGFAADKDGELDEVIWSKIAQAFPGWSATYAPAYDNAAVLSALQSGGSVIVQVDAAPIGNPGGLHAVRYIGGAQLHDPWDGTQKPTSTYPTVKAFNVLRYTAPAQQAPTPPAATSAAFYPETQPHIDLNNKESVKAAVNTWVDVENGVYVRKDAYLASLQQLAQAAGVDGSSSLAAIVQAIQNLRTAAQVASQPVQSTLSSLPPQEKSAILDHLANATEEVKKLLGL